MPLQLSASVDCQSIRLKTSVHPDKIKSSRWHTVQIKQLLYKQNHEPDIHNVSFSDFILPNNKNWLRWLPAWLTWLPWLPAWLIVTWLPEWLCSWPSACQPDWQGCLHDWNACQHGWHWCQNGWGWHDCMHGWRGCLHNWDGYAYG